MVIIILNLYKSNNLYKYTAVEVNSYLDTGALILIHFHCVNLLELCVHTVLNIHEATFII